MSSTTEPHRLLTGLNEQQQQAVITTTGPVLILAGAGSGKTKALTHRFAYLIQEAQISPLSILCVTFTNKAAQEMRDRISRLTGGGTERYPWLGTFHSIAVRILRRELDKTGLGYTSSFTIYDAGDSLTATKRAMEILNIDQKQYNPRSVHAQISGAKNEMVSCAEYGQFAIGPFQRVVFSVYQEYEKLLKQANALDFDDILMILVKVFQGYPEILAEYQRRFAYIMVDEYQDTNRVQYLLVKMLAAGHQNIFVIGDDWQSVYSWRGADFRNILDFHKDYPAATIIKLEQNYRSTQTILDAAQAVITKNKDRSDKKLWTDGPTGSPISVVEVLNEREEGEFIVRECKALVKSAAFTAVHSLDDCVILYRTNAQSRLLEETLVRLGLPYRMVGGIKFYERKEVKDLLAYARLLCNPQDWASLDRIINVPARGIGPKSASQIREINTAAIIRGDQSATGLAPKVAGFFTMINQLYGWYVRADEQKLPIRTILEEIYHKTGYRDFTKDGTIEGESRHENILELIGSAERHESLQEFLENVALVQDSDEQRELSAEQGMVPGQVTLMTLHAAKGLEFPVVFMVGMEEGIFPHTRSLDDKTQMEEERRLAYVGITRAMHRLYLIHAFERRLYGQFQSNSPSRFIAEIPQELTETLR
jgi:DNA helicase II / ATP-dependent DNA helicase PcrA